jgi:Ca-activated chloride channel homolog
VRRLLLAAPIVLLVAAIRPEALSHQTFSSRIEAVRVDVLVTEDGVPVSGLTAADFEVRDNGVVQQVDLVSSELIPLNVVLALDLSSSVEGGRLINLREAGGALLDGLTRRDQAGLITFSHVVAQPSRLTDDVDLLRSALTRAKASGGTSLIDGVFAGLMLAESGSGRPLVVVFSDGYDTSSWLREELVLANAQRMDPVVYAVAVGRGGRHAFLEELTRSTGGRLFSIESTKDLRGTFVRVLDEFRHRYLLSYSLRGVAAAGYHRLDVRVRRRSVTVQARRGYQVGSDDPGR